MKYSKGIGISQFLAETKSFSFKDKSLFKVVEVDLLALTLQLVLFKLNLPTKIIYSLGKPNNSYYFIPSSPPPPNKMSLTSPFKGYI
jgi:hypothetical protein